MNLREHEKGGDLFSVIEHQQKITKRIAGVLKLKTIIDWNALPASLIEVTGCDKKDWSNRLFSCFHQMLEKQDLIAKARSFIDASFVDTPKQHDSRVQKVWKKVLQRESNDLTRL